MASDFNLPKIEEKVLKFWKDRKIFERTLENRAHGRRFVFFEGPPFPNAKAHVGNVFTRCCKDIFCRYKNMRGFNTLGRRGGWDVHGLPVELQLEKTLGLKGKPDIEKYGIDKFNKAAREMVWGFKEDWDKLTERIGFWIDIENPYITSDSSYIESLWYIISQIWKKKLLFRAFKVVPYCSRCGTSLSNFEVAQGYEKIKEASVYLKFKIVGEENLFILSWTTTPWTLPGNVALAINPSLKYIKIQVAKKSKGYNQIHFYILAEERLAKIKEILEKENFEIKSVPEEVPAKELLKMEYEPLFEIPSLKSEKSYKIYPADFVTAEEGTGVVHTAVMYGEDDYNLGLKVGLPMVHTVDEAGKFKGVNRELDGLYVKSQEAEKIVLKHLESRGTLMAIEQYEHDYPFCWRCKTPLLYYARNSWFIAISKLKKKLLKNNEKINWIPAHLKEGRFGEFLRDVKDWALSRERFWGTPLPVWQCENCGEYKVVGSLEELEENRFRKPNTYFILRHGQREQSVNEQGEELVNSQLELDKYRLTPEGVEKIKEVAKRLKEEGGVDFIFSSPFLRTRQTAEIVAKELGLEISIDQRIKEIDEGIESESKPRNHLAPAGEGLDFDFRFGGKENWREVRARMFSFIKDLDKKYEGGKILIVSHGDPLWLLYSLTMNFSEKEAITKRKEVYLKPGELREIKFKNFPYNEGGEVDIHRPYVDEIFLRCPKCQRGMKRIKEVVDVWFDSGAMPFAQYHWPFEKRLDYPADFIAEGLDQTRGWFYTLHAVGTLMGRGPAYKNVMSLGLILDEKRKKMSKSKGNVIDPWDIVNKQGADIFRWYFFTVNSPAEPKLFSVDALLERSGNFFVTLLNILRFFELYAKPGDRKPRIETAQVIDRWILSKLNSLADKVTKALDEYDLNGAARPVETFVIEDFSNWWLRRSRDRFQRPKNSAALERDVKFLCYLLSEISKILAPFIPFAAEHIYKKVNNKKESVHLEDWPKPKKKFINLGLESRMEELRNFVALGLAQRKAANIKVRQPLTAVTLKKSEKFEPELEKLILAELNVKSINYNPAQEEELTLDKKITPELLKESYAREVMRQIQDMRKEAGYKLDEKIYAAWASDNKDVVSMMGVFGKEIAENTLLMEFGRGHRSKEAFDVEKETDLGPQAKIWLGIRRKK